MPSDLFTQFHRYKWIAERRLVHHVDRHAHALERCLLLMTGAACGLLARRYVWPRRRAPVHWVLSLRDHSRAGLYTSARRPLWRTLSSSAAASVASDAGGGCGGGLGRSLPGSSGPTPSSQQQSDVLNGTVTCPFTLARNIAAWIQGNAKLPARSTGIAALATSSSSSVSIADVVLRRRGYAVGYHHRYASAVWVGFVISRRSVLDCRKVPRCDPFVADLEIDNAHRPRLADFRAADGLHRGHLAACATVGFCPSSARETFLLSNVALMTPRCNLVAFKYVEGLCRRAALRHEGPVAVVTGPLFAGGPDKVRRCGRIPVAVAFYAAFLHVRSGRCVAFLVRNDTKTAVARRPESGTAAEGGAMKLKGDASTLLPDVCVMSVGRLESLLSQCRRLCDADDSKKNGVGRNRGDATSGVPAAIDAAFEACQHIHGGAMLHRAAERAAVRRAGRKQIMKQKKPIKASIPSSVDGKSDPAVSYTNREHPPPSSEDGGVLRLFARFETPHPAIFRRLRCDSRAWQPLQKQTVDSSFWGIAHRPAQNQ